MRTKEASGRSTPADKARADFQFARHIAASSLLRCRPVTAGIGLPQTGCGASQHAIETVRSNDRRPPTLAMLLCEKIGSERISRLQRSARKAEASRASAVIAAQSPRSIIAFGVSQEPPTQATFGSAKNKGAVSTLTPPVGQNLV